MPATAAASVDARVDRLLGMDFVVAFLDDAEHQRLATFRQKCLHLDGAGGLHIPSEAGALGSGDRYVALASEILITLPVARGDLSRLGSLDDGRMQAVACVAGAGDGDAGKSRRHQQALVFGPGERARNAADLLFGGGEGEHVGARVQAIGDAMRRDPAGGYQHVESAARPEVQDGFAGPELSDHQRIAAAEAGPEGRFRRHAAISVGGGADAAFLGGAVAVADFASA
jgi:hypothetical protein